MILHCIGCGKASEDRVWAASVHPLCANCAGQSHWKYAMTARQEVRNSPSSALVHIHDDLYVDAARVVSVEARDDAGLYMNQPCVVVIWSIPPINDKEVMSRCFDCTSLDEARQLARAITERVNAGRMPQAQVQSMIRKSVADECNCKMCVSARQFGKAAPSDVGGIQVVRNGTVYVGQAAKDLLEAEREFIERGLMDEKGRMIPATNKGLFERAEPRPRSISDEIAFRKEKAFFAAIANGELPEITNLEDHGRIAIAAAVITKTHPSPPAGNDTPPGDDGPCSSSPPDPYAVGEPVRLKTGGTVMYVESAHGSGELRCRWTKPSGLTERALFRREDLEGAA